MSAKSETPPYMDHMNAVFRTNLRAAVDALNLDITDPFTKLLAMAIACADSRDEWQRELAAAKEAVEEHHRGMFCPHCRPCRKEPAFSEMEDALRSLASWLGCGGYNMTERFKSGDAALFEQKIREGVNAIHAVEGERLKKAEAERDALKREVEVLRQYGNKDCTTMADEALAALDAGRKR